MSEISQAERTAMEGPFGSDLTVGERAMWMHGRDYGRERERTLEDVLTIIAGDYGCGLIEPPDQSLPPEGDPCHERYPDDPEKWCVSCIASMALLGLAPSQPEVLSERSATEPGEPEKVNVPGRRVIEDDGSEGNMVVASSYTRQQAIIDALKILQNRTVGSPEACKRAIDVLAAGLAAEENAQPDHGPGEPSDDPDAQRWFRVQCDHLFTLLNRPAEAREFLDWLREEADIERVAEKLHSLSPHFGPLRSCDEGEKFRQNARELLDLVLGEEASRV